MTKHSPIVPPESLLERAAAAYDLGSLFRTPEAAPVAVEPEPVAPVAEAIAEPVIEDAPEPETVEYTPVEMVEPVAAPASLFAGRVETIDTVALAEAGFIVPGGPVTGISEEFRIVKRQLLQAAATDAGDARARRILICSALPGEGKTFCAVNLALSMAAERDTEVLLVDADFAKPSVLRTLGIDTDAGHPQRLGLMDAIADPSIDIESCVIRTDVPNLSVLPAGRPAHHDTEYLASARTAKVLDALGRGHPGRIILFDSPPALAASPASVLATHVGRVLMVVRADQTSESALRDAIGLLEGCADIRLLLNGVKFSVSGRRFGTYYGQGA